MPPSILDGRGGYPPSSEEEGVPQAGVEKTLTGVPSVDANKCTYA